MAGGGAGNQNNKNPIWRRNLSCINNITNLTKFWHKNEFKKHSMAKRACGKSLETVLRNSLGSMQRNVTSKSVIQFMKILYSKYVVSV
jgi:hypothetical protein